jgi:hypothetical protein
MRLLEGGFQSALIRFDLQKDRKWIDATMEIDKIPSISGSDEYTVAGAGRVYRKWHNPPNDNLYNRHYNKPAERNWILRPVW